MTVEKILSITPGDIKSVSATYSTCKTVIHFTNVEAADETNYCPGCKEDDPVLWTKSETGATKTLVLALLRARTDSGTSKVGVHVAMGT